MTDKAKEVTKKRILIVDDEPNIVKAVRARLEDSGYEAIAAYDGEEALKKAREEKPDLIILDLMLPMMDGCDVCRKLKLDEKYKAIPIIMFTAKFQPVDIRYGMAQGADAYITKPFDPKMLLDKIRELLK